MLIYALIPFLASILITPVYAKLDNQKLDLIQFVHQIAVEYKLPPEKLIGLFACESGWEVLARGDYRSETKEYMANGVAQFWQPTFDKFSKIYKVEGEYMNPKTQILLTVKMLSGEKEGW